MQPTSSSSRNCLWCMPLLAVFACAYIVFTLAARSADLYNDEAIEIMVARDMQFDRFYFFAPPYTGGIVTIIESLVPYANHFVFALLGGDLLWVRLLFILSLATACVFFYRTVAGGLSPPYAVLGVILLAGSSYTAFFNRLLHRNGVTFLWSCSLLLLSWRYVSTRTGRRVPAVSFACIPVAVLLGNLTYTPFKFIAVAFYLSFFLWALFASPRRILDPLAVLANLGLALGLGWLALRAADTSVAFLLERGEHVLVYGWRPQVLLAHAVSSLLMPVRYVESGDFLVEMTHIGFRRHTLSFLLAPFFAVGLGDALLAPDRTGFRRLALGIWLFGTLLLSLGGPELKHHYALFPLVILITVFGLARCGSWLRALPAPARSALASALVAGVLWTEARHLLWTRDGNDAVIHELRMPHAVAMEALDRSAAGASTVYIVEGYGKDALICYTRHDPKVRYIVEEEFGAFLRSLDADLASGRPVAVVMSYGASLEFPRRLGDLSACLEKSERTVNGWPVAAFLPRKCQRPARWNMFAAPAAR